MAQLVARLVWDQEVEGSSPSGPTNKTGESLFFCRDNAVESRTTPRSGLGV